MNGDFVSRTSLRNRMLSVLPVEEFDIIRPHLQATFFERGTLLSRAGDALQNCYFPNNGMISLLCVTEQGGSVEAGYVGFEGILGTPAILGKNDMPYEALVQAPTDCLVVNSAAVLELFNRGGVFHDVFLRFSYVVLKQMSQTCVCNHFHRIEARLCRWLTVMCERSGNKSLSLTHEFLAHMLGVQRTSIGSIAASLQAAGIIRYRRGRVEIIDFDRLKASACDCYSIVKDEHQAFLSDKKFHAMSSNRQTPPFN